MSKIKPFLIVLLFLFASYSCDKSDIKKDIPEAKFQYALSDSNYYKVTFTNNSRNATLYKWDFGDSQTSTVKNPTHIYENSGIYDVVLIADNDKGAIDSYSSEIIIIDVSPPYSILTGNSSKTWKLFREGTSMGIGPSMDEARTYWTLENNGERPCSYKQEWIFNNDGTFEFKENGEMWGEVSVFDGTIVNESCFPAIDANMINSEGADVRAWLGGTHSFTYNPSLGKLTLYGKGAWIGNIILSDSNYVKVPQESVTYDITFSRETNYDLMNISLESNDWFWDFTYVSYSVSGIEPEVVE